MLSASFGQSGDFTVVVTSEDGTTGKEESDGGDDERKDDGGAQRTEFKVGEFSKLAKSFSDDLFARHQAKRKKSEREKSQKVKKVKETKARSETFRCFDIFGHQSHAVPFNKSLAELIQTLLLLLQI